MNKDVRQAGLRTHVSVCRAGRESHCPGLSLLSRCELAGGSTSACCGGKPEQQRKSRSCELGTRETLWESQKGQRGGKGAENFVTGAFRGIQAQSNPPFEKERRGAGRAEREHVCTYLSEEPCHSSLFVFTLPSQRDYMNKDVRQAGLRTHVSVCRAGRESHCPGLSLLSRCELAGGSTSACCGGKPEQQRKSRSCDSGTATFSPRRTPACVACC
nr:hypothetical protein CFP56_04416 [Quercus suber]